MILAGEGRKDGGETEKKNNLPKKIRLRSTLLVNIRASTGIQVNIYTIYIYI